MSTGQLIVLSLQINIKQSITPKLTNNRSVVDKTHQNAPYRPIQKGPLCQLKVTLIPTDHRYTTLDRDPVIMTLFLS